MDLDHLPDLIYHQRFRRPGEGLMEVFDRHDWRKTFIPLHGWELAAILGALALFSDHPLLFGGLLLGYGLHLVMDQLGNEAYPLTYVLTYRILRGFDARHIWRDSPLLKNAPNEEDGPGVSRSDRAARFRAAQGVAGFYLCLLILVLLECRGFLPGEKITGILVLAATCGLLILVYAVLVRAPVARRFRPDRGALTLSSAGILLLIPTLALNYGYLKLVSLIADLPVEPAAPLLGEADLPRIVPVLLIAVLPAILEETAFRGLIQEQLGLAVRRGAALVITALLFALLHLDPIRMPYLFIVGLLLGWIRYRGGSLIPCIVVHFAHNLALYTMP